MDTKANLNLYCRNCKKPNNNLPHVRCKTCHGYAKQANTERNLKKRKEGYCSRCYKELQDYPFSTCKKCREYIKNRRSVNNSKGLCSECGKFPYLPGKKICGNCLEQKLELKKRDVVYCNACCKVNPDPSYSLCPKCRYKNKMRKDKVIQRKEKDCVKCGKPHVNSNIFCTDCNDKIKQVSKEYKESLKASGICVKCSKNPSQPNSFYCIDCKDKNNKFHKSYRIYRIENKLCVTCNTPLEPNSTILNCIACNEKIKKAVSNSVNKYREAGLCITCGKETPTNGKVRCDACHLKNKKQKFFKKPKRRCACGNFLTGCRMVMCKACLANYKGKVCVTCKQPNDSESQYCQRCRDIRNTHAKQKRMLNPTVHSCACGNKLLGHRKLCDSCKASKHIDKTRYCACGIEVTGHTKTCHTCKAINEKDKTRYCKCGKVLPKYQRICIDCKPPKVNTHTESINCISCGKPSKISLCNKCKDNF